MKFSVLPALLFAGLSLLAPHAHAAARQYVVVVAEDISPQLLDLGQSYIRKADDDPTLTSAFTTLAGGETPRLNKVDTVTELRGLLETAHASGFKTGLVTTADLTTEVPLFTKSTGVSDATTTTDFLAGAGRTKLTAVGAALAAAGGTYAPTPDALMEEIKGRVLVAQAEKELAYALDRNPETESGLAELARIAMDTLGGNDTPFVLVVHDTLVQKALTAKDTPALFEEFRELNSILGDALSRREANLNLAVTALLPSATSAPHFAANADHDASFGIISTLGRSYAGVGTLLRRAKIQTVDDFIDPEGGEYRDWKLSDADKKRISTGKLSGEAAVRAFYEPLLGLEYTPETTPATVYVVGLNTDKDIATALKAAVSTPAKTN